MALVAQTLTRNINRELSTTVEKMLPGVKRAAFLNSPSAYVFFGNGLDEAFGDRFMSGSAKRTQGGGEIQIMHEFGKNSNNKTMSGPWDTFNTAPQDQVRWSEANWSHHSSAVVLSDYDQLINRGPEALANRLDLEMRNCMSSFTEMLIVQVIDGGPANGLTGIHSLISADDTVQGIDGGDYAGWNSNGLASKSATSTAKAAAFTGGAFATTGITNWRIAFNRASYGNTKPNVIFTTEEIHEAYEAVLLPQERYAAIADRGDASFVSLAFKRKPVVPDPLWTSGVTTFLNTECIYIICLSGADLQFKGFERAQNQEAIANELQFKGQLVTDNRRYNNKVTEQTV